jgi:hypothetical protein
MNTYPGPVPIFSNPPIEPQFYEPSRFVISSIVLGSTTTVTTSVDHDYVVGQQIRLLIPSVFGTRQLNNQTALVLSIPAANEVVINIDSNRYDPFISSPAFVLTSAQIVAIGDVNTGLITTTGRTIPTTTIPGAFVDIS